MDWAVTAPVLGALSTVPDWSSITSVIASLGALAGVVYVGSRTRKSTQEANTTAKDSQALTEAQTAWEEMRKMRVEHKDDREQWEKEREEDRVEREQDRREREELHVKVDSTTRMLSASLRYIEDLVNDIRAAGVKIVRSPPHDLRSHLAHLFRDRDDAA